MRLSRAIVYSFVAVFFVCGEFAFAQTEHVIQRGETLFGIARLYKVDVAVLQSANSISDPSKVRIGQKLIIPDGNQNLTNGTAPAAANVPYVVKAGDTLYGIARGNSMDISDLLAINNLSRNTILKVGQTIMVPAKSGTTVAVPVTPTPKPTASPGNSTSNPTGSQVPVNLPNQGKLSEGSNLKWPHNGDRFAVQGKLPGVVIHAKQGDPVLAISNGRVAYSGPHATLGHVIFIQGNNGYVYIYGGNEDSVLKLGDTVNSGERIGTVGLTPGIKEAQVYFGVWKKGTYINPAAAPRD
jgi:murein DD-endopeptidase MepM/ murein hydrolase activator NlpD